MRGQLALCFLSFFKEFSLPDGEPSSRSVRGPGGLPGASPREGGRGPAGEDGAGTELGGRPARPPAGLPLPGRATTASGCWEPHLGPGALLSGVRGRPGQAGKGPEAPSSRGAGPSTPRGGDGDEGQGGAGSSCAEQTG